MSGHSKWATIHRKKGLLDRVRPIINKELKTEDSVLLAYNPFVIKKIAGYLSGKIKIISS